MGILIPAVSTIQASKAVGPQIPRIFKHTIWKSYVQFEKTTLPNGLVFPRNTALPVLQIQNTFLRPRRFRKEAERMIPPPLLAKNSLHHQHSVELERSSRVTNIPLLLQSVLAKSHF